MPYFKRDKAAAKIQESDWRNLVRSAAREAKFVARPCVYCGVLMTPCTPETQGRRWTNETKDHIVPRCKGGTVVVPCCEGCNRDKHHLTIDEWRCVLMFRMKRPILFYHFELIALRNLLIKWTSLIGRLVTC